MRLQLPNMCCVKVRHHRLFPELCALLCRYQHPSTVYKILTTSLVVEHDVPFVSHQSKAPDWNIQETGRNMKLSPSAFLSDLIQKTWSNLKLLTEVWAVFQLKCCQFVLSLTDKQSKHFRKIAESMNKAYKQAKNSPLQAKYLFWPLITLLNSYHPTFFHSLFFWRLCPSISLSWSSSLLSWCRSNP